MSLARMWTVGALLLAAGTASAEPAKPQDAAAALCVKNGATVTMEIAPNGAKHGVCVFPSGSRIDEWAYFRNKHRGL